MTSINIKFKHKNILEDIASFENYQPYWDNIIFNIIEHKSIDCFSIQNYHPFDSYERGDYGLY